MSVCICNAITWFTQWTHLRQLAQTQRQTKWNWQKDGRLGPEQKTSAISQALPNWHTRSLRAQINEQIMNLSNIYALSILTHSQCSLLPFPKLLQLAVMPFAHQCVLSKFNLRLEPSFLFESMAVFEWQNGSMAICWIIDTKPMMSLLACSL